MYLNQLKNISVALLLTCILGGGLVFGAYQTLAGEQAGATRADSPSPEPVAALVPDKQGGGQNPKDGDRDTIAWGKPHNGLRIGLSPGSISVSADQKAIQVTVWFENVGKEDVKIQLWDELLRFVGTKGGKPFTVQYAPGARWEWPAPPPQITLKPGALSRLPVSIPIEGPESANNFVGLLRPGKGAPLTLAARWFSKADSDRMRPSTKQWPPQPAPTPVESGRITVEFVAAAPTVGDAISWGKPHNGLRVGLSPRTLQIAAKQDWIDATLWFENVGKEDVQVQPWDELVSFTGTKAGKPFTVQYQSGSRKAWPAPPPKITLKPGMLTRFKLMIPIEGPENANDFVGLPRPGKGAPLTLTAGWSATHPGDFPQPANPKIIESGNIMIELTAAVPPAVDPISWGETHKGLRLGMTPGTITVQPNQKSIEVMVWFENVGKEDAQVHPWDESLRFAGQKGDKSFKVVYSPGERAAWPVPPLVTLKPGILVRLPVSIPFEGPGNANDFVGLLRPGSGEPLSLAASWHSGLMADSFECGRVTIELATGK